MDLVVPKVISIWEAYGVLIDLWLHDDVDLVGRISAVATSPSQVGRTPEGVMKLKTCRGSSYGLVIEELDREKSGSSGW